MLKGIYRAVPSLVRLLPMPFLLAGCAALPTPAVTRTLQASSESPVAQLAVATPCATGKPIPTARVQLPTPTPTLVTASTSMSPAPAAAPTSAAVTPTPIRVTPLVTAPGPAAGERIRFPTGATQTTVEGYLPADALETFVMHVARDQYVAMDAGVGTMGDGLRFSVVGADGVVVKPMGDAHLRAIFPNTQDYIVELASDVGAVHYVLSIMIPVRICFAPGADSEEVSGSLAGDDVDHYVIRGLAGQRLIVDPNTSRGQLRLTISAAEGQLLLSGRVGPPGGTYDGVLPATQDYLISVRAEGGSGADYGLGITLPPL